MIRGRFPRVGLKWRLRGGWGWCARALGLVVRLPRKIPGILEPVAKSWESSAENSGNSEIFASSDGIVGGCTNQAPRTCHVTQPRASVKVSCSRAGHKGVTGGRGNQKRTTKGRGTTKRRGTTKGRETTKKQHVLVCAEIEYGSTVLNNGFIQ